MTSNTFFIANGLVSLVGVLLLIWHMNEHWVAIGRQSNQVWAMCLLGYAVLVAGASAENLAGENSFEFHHIGTTIMSVTLVLIVLWSIKTSKLKK